MNRIVSLVQVISLSLAVVTPGWSAEANPDQAKAVAEIEKLGGKVTFDEKLPDKPVKAVDLTGGMISDAGLGYLEGFTQLQSLDLTDNLISDAGWRISKG